MNRHARLELCGFEGADQAVLHRVQRCRSAAGDHELGVDVLHMNRRGLRRDHELASYLPVGVAAREEHEHLDLACGQATGAAVARWYPGACGLEHRVDCLAIEPTCLRLVLEGASRADCSEWLPVMASLGHCAGRALSVRKAFREGLCAVMAGCASAAASSRSSRVREAAVSPCG